MSHEPVLKQTDYLLGERKRRIVKAEGGLHYLRGNKTPYFTLTMSSWIKSANGKMQEDAFGAAHEELVKLWPDLADLAALHLSDWDGVPMHGAANGWYSMAGSLPEQAGERYTALTAERHFPITPPADKPWQDTEYRFPTQDECLQFFADHCRIALEEAKMIRAELIEFGDTIAPVYPEPTMQPEDFRPRWKAMRDRCTEIMERMKPMWKVQADSCIEKHGLLVFGDLGQMTVRQAREKLAAKTEVA